MFIALRLNSYALQRSAMCFAAFSLHSAPDGAGNSGTGGYKHFAPPEQEPRSNEDDLLVQSRKEQKQRRVAPGSLGCGRAMESQKRKVDGDGSFALLCERF